MPRPARNIYLSMKALPEAQGLWLSRVSGLRTAPERIPVAEALGRVTSEPVIAERSVPHYHGAAMDGYALRAEATFGAGETTPLRLTLGREAFAVDTGDPLPDGADAVVMVEHVQPAPENAIEIRAAAFPWQHVRKVGEDIVAGELIIAQRHALRPADLGALLAAGVHEVAVHARPRVFVQPTGTELVSAARASEAAPGEIVEFNGTVLASLASECGATATLRPPIPDDYESLRAMLDDAVSSGADLVLVNAGSSAGSEDYTAAVIAELGEVLVHGVAMMPGKPVILGIVRGKPVVGVPGYPVSAIMAFEQFARPLLFSMQGRHAPAWETAEAVLARKTASRLGLEEFVRVILGRVAGSLVAMPLQRGAGIITSLTRADAILAIPQELEGLDANATVSVRLLRPRDELDHALLMIGSHDNTIDLIGTMLKERDSRIHLSSSNVGSLGGLLAVRRGQAHLAGSHLLDGETGDYNFADIARQLPGVPVRLVTLALREQGLLVKPKNPKNIRGVGDLARPDVTYINRQATAGTRVLLDHELRRAGVDPASVRGYDQEETTHMGVAVAVLSGRADAGMAVLSSAQALGLDFIPVASERYDLVIPEYAWNDPKIRLLLDIISTDDFRARVRKMGGYDPSRSGTLLGVWNGKKWEKS